MGANMNKEDFLRQIAEKGYDVGFGAKKHFATLDIIEKIPGLIGFISLVVGIMGLYYDSMSSKDIATIMIIGSIIVLYINFYNSGKNKYDEQGRALTEIYNELKSYYYKIKGSSVEITEQDLEQLKAIESRYSSSGISKQILFSGWYAHYKFFGEHQISWIDEQLNFNFWKDKVPMSMKVFSIFFIIGAVMYSFGGCILDIDMVNNFFKEVE